MNEYRIVKRDGRDSLGEGPSWSPRRNALFWVDILAPSLHRLDIASGAVDRWAMPEAIGWAIERRGRGDFVIGLKSGIHSLELDPLTIVPIVNPEPDRPHNRLNDAKVDSFGRIWAGSKDDRDIDASGALYRIDADFSCIRCDDGYVVANGPTFSLDGRRLYHSDSGRRRVYAFDLADDGSLANKRVFIDFAEAWGYPDGMTTDAEDCLWIAHWGGGRISRFSPDGKLMRSISLPASQITSCAFAGAGLDRLFVTSAATGRDDEPLAGSLFEVDAGVAGIAPMAFAG